jgi:hypothetical protein
MTVDEAEAVLDKLGPWLRRHDHRLLEDKTS